MFNEYFASRGITFFIFSSKCLVIMFLGHMVEEKKTLIIGSTYVK